MNPYIVFTKLGLGSNIYPNWVQASSSSAAIKKVHASRSNHTAIGVSYISSFVNDIDEFTAIIKVIPPSEEWKTGGYLTLT